MPLYNAERYVRAAIDSIICQTMGDFELLVINDGSTDGSRDVVSRLDDPRIRIVDLQHVGLTTALNEGLSRSRGKYIARMDSDDAMHPMRLEKQVAFLENNQDIGVIGCGLQVIDEKGMLVNKARWPATDLAIRWLSLLATPFPHPAVMMCREIVSSFGLEYDQKYSEGAQDYDFFVRLLEYTHGANLPELLLSYRVHRNSVSGTRKPVQVRNHDEISHRVIRNTLPEMQLTQSQVTLLRKLFAPGHQLEPEYYQQRVTLCHLYLDMFQELLKKHPQSPGRSGLHRHTALRSLRRVAGSLPRSTGSARLLVRLAKLCVSCR